MAFIIDQPGGYAPFHDSFELVNTTGLLQGDTLKFEDELLWVANVLTSSTVLIQRGYAGTTAVVIPDGSILELQVPAIEIINDMSSGADWNVEEQSPGAMIFQSPNAISTNAAYAWTYLLENAGIPADWARLVFSMDYWMPRQDNIVWLGFSKEAPPIGYQFIATPVIQNAYLFKSTVEGFAKLSYHKRLAGVETNVNLQDSVGSTLNQWTRTVISLAKVDAGIEISCAMKNTNYPSHGANVTVDSTDIFSGVLYPFITGRDGWHVSTNLFRDAKLQVFGAGGGGSEDWPFGTKDNFPFSDNDNWPTKPTKPWGPTIE